MAEYISDTYSLPNRDIKDLFLQSEEIGFIDHESLDDKSKFYFNGNLFRRDSINKINNVLASLKPDEAIKVNDLDQLLTLKGCVTLEACKLILGEPLLLKLQSIGMYDFNDVSNTKETKTFITKPSAFSKYGNPFEEDAMDLAKAFVSSLYYGMNFSTSGRGKIVMLKQLLNKLVSGLEVGPATAIGEDYKVLEFKRVIQLRKDPNSKMYFMKLLKRNIGKLALQVLEFGDTTEQIIIESNLFLGSMTNYVGPEYKRTLNRKKQNVESKKSVGEILRTFRS